jgi:PD-(D/E)XK nuclease superfamily
MRHSTRAIKRDLCAAIDHVLLHRSRTSHSCKCGYRMVWNEIEPGQCSECDEALLRTTLLQADQFRFDPLEHRYFLGQRELPAVSRILDVGFPLDIADVRLMAARICGTAVHLACELDDLGELDEDKLVEELWPYLEAWRSFRKSSGFVPEAIECRLYHKSLFYAGTIDRIGRLRSGRQIIIDIKTGGKYARYRVQLAAYVNLLDNPMDYLRGSVTLDPDGSSSFDEFSRESFPEDLAIFRSCLNIHNFKLKYKMI